MIHGGKTYAVIDILQWKHDSNMTLNCLLSSLVQNSKNGKLTPTLYIQLDNCGRENKNKFFLGMMAYLVKKKVTKEVLLSFLMTGHTHEGNDNIYLKLNKLKQLEPIELLNINCKINNIKHYYVQHLGIYFLNNTMHVSYIYKQFNFINVS